VEVAAGWAHTVARTEEGEIWVWGESNDREGGILSQGNLLLPPTPLPPFPEKIVKIACGGYHTLFLGDKGTLWSCGWNYYGNTGLGQEGMSHPITPLFLGGGPKGVKEFAAGWYHSMVLLQDGSLLTWGYNEYDQTGHPTNDRFFKPLLLPFSEEVAGIGCCCDHSFLVTSEGDLYTWGRGSFGTLGHGDFQNQHVPKKVEGIKVRVPMPRHMRWEEVGLWLFLGREDGCSPFWRIPVGVTYHFVEMHFRK
jgi:alpha-tubulin suppressor-like RCC1 family protein